MFKRFSRRVRNKILHFVPKYWQLKFELYSTNRFYRKLVEQAESSGDYEKARDLSGEWSAQTQIPEMEYEITKTRRLIHKARKLGAFIPEEIQTGSWEKLHGYSYLTDKGYAEILKNIRTARKERLEPILSWGKLLSIFFGGVIGYFLRYFMSR